MIDFRKRSMGITRIVVAVGALVGCLLGIGLKHIHELRKDRFISDVDADALQLAEKAATAALDGRIEEAQQLFAKAQQATTNLRVLHLAYEFYHRTGDLAKAEEMLDRWLAISGRDAETADTAAALGNLGVIYWRRGELDRAEEMQQKALAIHEKLGRQEGMATNYGNLGLIDQARGELHRAEEMHRKALAINEMLGLQEGMANDYGNLGGIYNTRGDLDRAEEMHQQALAINEMLSLQEGIAAEYGSLGSLAYKRGELERARELWTKARDLYAKIGIPHMVKQVQEWLDVLPKPAAESRRASVSRGKGQGTGRKT